MKRILFLTLIGIAALAVAAGAQQMGSGNQWISGDGGIPKLSSAPTIDGDDSDASPAYGGSFGLAFGMDGEIDPDKVILRQEHHTPDYTVAAYRMRHEVIATNGELHTFHAGAWLGDGLHEGAVRSGLAVSRLLGGAEI